MNSTTLLRVIIWLAGCAVSQAQIEVKRCQLHGTLPTQRTEIQLMRLEVGHRVLAELLPSSLTEIEVRWDKSNEITCLDLISGSELDVLAAQSLMLKFVRSMQTGAGASVIRILRPRRRPADLYSTNLALTDCASVQREEVALLAGLNKRFQNQLTQSLACFERARVLSPQSLYAQLASAVLSGLVQRPEQEIRDRYSALSNLHPAFQSRSKFENARLPRYYGRPQEALNQLAEFLGLAAATTFMERAAKTLYELALTDGELEQARLGQEEVVVHLKKQLQSHSASGSDFHLAFAYDRLGLLREASQDLEGALSAYTLASESSKHDLYSLEPRLGRIRILSKLGKFGKSEEQECIAWRTRVKRPGFRIPDKRSGGLALVMAQIEFSCGSKSAAIKRATKLIRERPTWENPLLAVADFLVSDSHWRSAQGFRRAAASLKSGSDHSKLLQMLSEVESSVTIQQE